MTIEIIPPSGHWTFGRTLDDRSIGSGSVTIVSGGNTQWVDIVSLDTEKIESEHLVTGFGRGEGGEVDGVAHKAGTKNKTLEDGTTVHAS